MAAVLPLLAGCAGTSDVAARTTPDPSTTAAAPRSCGARTQVDSAGRFEWNGTTYAIVGQTTLKNEDTSGMLFALGCDGARAYGVRGIRPECQLLVLNADAFDAYAPSPLPAGCPAPVPAPSTMPVTDS